MRLVDEIYYRRLNRIRDELDCYIENRIEKEYYEASASIEIPMVRHENVGRTMDKFLQVMPLMEDVSDFEFDDEDGYESDEEQAQFSQEVPMLVPARPKLSDRQMQMPRTDFLRSESPKRSIDEMLENKAETFSTMLLRLIDEKGLKDSDAYKRANIDRRLFSKIRGDEDYVPSKKTVISFCLALQLTMEEAKKLLETAGYALSTASRFDLIIMYLIENKEYNIHFANIVLEDYGEGTLSK